MSTTTKQENSAQTRIDEVVAAYNQADRATKARMRADAKAAVESAVRSGNWEDAAAAQKLADSLVTSAPAKPEVDWSQVVADRLADLNAAVGAIIVGDIDLPEGVEVDFDNLPEGVVSDDFRARYLVIKARKSDRGNVGGYITEALASEVESDSDGWVRVSQLRTYRGGDYATTPPSAGAVSAAIKSCIEGDREISGVECGYDGEGRLAARLA